MKLISLTDKDVRRAIKFAEQLHQQGKYQVHYNTIGTLGEIAWGKFTNQKPNLKIYPKGKGDGGTDFKDTQVKTVTFNGRGEKELKVNIDKLSKKVKKLVLMYVNPHTPNDVYIVGEVSKQNFLNNSQQGKYGDTVMYLGENSLDVIF